FVNRSDLSVFRIPAPPPQADLSSTKTDHLTTVTAGDGVTHTYTIVVTNNSSSVTAMVVTVTDIWPVGFTRGTTTTTQGMCTLGTGSFTCALGDVAPNSSVTIMANYTVPATTPPGDQTNVVTVSSATLDLNPE